MNLRSYGTMLWILSLPIAVSSSIAQDQQAPEPVSLKRSAFAPVPLNVTKQSDALEKNSSPPVNVSSTAPLVTVGSSLAIVLGLFAAFVWVSRKSSKNSIGNREIPNDAVRLLGKKSLGPNASIALVRCGKTLLIVGVHASGMQRLGEITDEDEARHLEALCTGEAKASFNATLAEIQREPIKRGFVGEDIQSAPKSRGNLFA